MTMIVSGINLTSLQEAFAGSEDVLAQMLALFQVQAAERMGQLGTHLGAWDAEAARTVLHSLVNISGAVRAYGMSELAKTVGDAVRGGDQAKALAVAAELEREVGRVQAQVQVLLDAARFEPKGMWGVTLPAA